MFDLLDSLVEEIMFAMEDQDNESLVDPADGSLHRRPRRGPAAAAIPEGAVAVPEWTSRDGFRVMEGFLAGVRNPSARRELQEALSRGRGVFKAFKECLVAYPEVERAFRDYKARAMGRRIREWHDELRERAGLERLGPEPEDPVDLILSEFAVESGGHERLGLFLPLVDEAEGEALETMPGLLAVREAERLREALSEEDWLGTWISDGEGGALAAAAGFLDEAGGRILGRIAFLHVLPDFRRTGLGFSLLETLDEKLRAEGAALVVVDAPLLPPSLGESLSSRGYAPWGLRLVIRK